MIHVNSIKSFDKDIREIKESIIDDISFFVKNGVTHYYRDVYVIRLFAVQRMELVRLALMFNGILKMY